MSSSTIPQRSKEEYILLALCVTGFTGILPFAVLRLINGDMLLAVIDSILVVGVALIGVFVWNTQKVRLPGFILTMFYMFGMVAAVHVSKGLLIYWAFPTMLAAYFLVKPREAAIMNSIAMLLLLPTVMTTMRSIEISSILVTLLLTNAFSFIFARKMQLQHEKLEKLATRDSLTGAGNRRLFDERVFDCINQYKRTQVPAALILIDIDHFKKVNDEHGHGKGDEVLIGLVALLRDRLRAIDSIYRIGGEEFAIIIHPADTDRVIDLAESLRQLVESSKLLTGQHLTISLGLAICDDSDTDKSWFERADKALYKAKNNGRNQACLEPFQGKIV